MVAGKGGVLVRLAIGSVPVGFQATQGEVPGRGNRRTRALRGGAIVAWKADSPRALVQRHDIVVLRHYA